ncbi:MAG: hypothetical protein AB7V50_00375 [Vampirovibrionia bacterium]
MEQKWIEINKASKEFDLDLEYLCDLVINGTITTTTCDDTLLIDRNSLCSLEDLDGMVAKVDIESVEEALEELKVECAWLKSENMKYKTHVEDYQEKFVELREIQRELIDVINHQSETIRILRGYHTQARKAGMLDDFNSTGEPRKPGISLWMLLPMIGLILGAIIEICSKYQIHNTEDVLRYVGLM